MTTTTARPQGASTTDGASAGAIATVVMSLWMFVAQRLGWEGEQPPERIVEAAFDAAKVSRSERAENVLASAAHLGYGTFLGVVYTRLRRRTRRRSHPVLAGMCFGLAVWSANYLTWIPWLGILPPPRKDRPGRPLSMVVAHLLFGAVLGALVDRRDQRWPPGRP